MKFSNNNIQKAYNTWAKQYDTNSNKTRDLDARVTSKTLEDIHFKTVLELGCGTGKNTLFLLTKAESIIGLDFSTGMLSKAKEKICDNRVQFIETDLTKAWNIKNHSFDLVTSSLTLEHIQDLTHIFQQAHQALCENGLFFICELHPFKQYAGSKARFETENGLVELDVFTHHVSDYLLDAKDNDFILKEMNEWFDEEDRNEIPRLISFLFMKSS